MREQAGYGGSQLGRIVGMSPAQVTQMESGRIGISAERLRTVAAACMCTNQPLIDALARGIAERGRGWWEDYQETVAADLIDLAEIEGRAERLSTYTITFMPGLLQTSAYADSVFARAIPPLPHHEVNVRMGFRMRRQRVVRSGAVPYSAFIHEAALRMQFSGPEILAEQLGALRQDSESSNVSVRVVPFDVESLPGPSENFTFAEGLVPELDTVQIDMSHGCLLFDSPAQLASYREILAQMERVALSEDESRAFIRSIQKEMEAKHG